jgi:hypothetical protein
VDGSAPRRRAADHALGTRVTVVEEQLYALGQRFDRHLVAEREQLTALRNVDERLTEAIQEIRIGQARMLAGIAVAIFVAQLAAPVILERLGLLG